MPAFDPYQLPMALSSTVHLSVVEIDVKNGCNSILACINAKKTNYSTFAMNRLKASNGATFILPRLFVITSPVWRGH